ncbi:universal stress protein [Streptomyces nogalater]
MSEHQKSSAARVVVGVSGSPGSLTALARAAEEARRRGAQLWPVLAWEPPGGELGSRRAPVAADMVPQWELLARERLLKALRDVFGSTDTGVPGTALTVRGAAGPALVRIAEREDDVIVVGAGRRNRLLRALTIGRPVLPRSRRLPRTGGAALSATGHAGHDAPPEHAPATPGHREPATGIRARTDRSRSARTLTYRAGQRRKAA